MAVGDIYKVTIVWANGGTGENVTSGLHVRQAGIVAPTIDEMGDAVQAWWNVGTTPPAQKVHHDNSMALSAVELRRVDPLEPVIQVYTSDLPIAGTGSGDMLPSQVAVLVSLRTLKSGRSYRGRMYLPTICESESADPGVMTAPDATEIKDQFQTLLDELTGLDAIPVVWSPTLSEANDITQVKVDRLLRTQRRRADERSVYV